MVKHYLTNEKLIAVLLAAITFLAGGFIGDYRASAQINSMQAEFKQELTQVQSDVSQISSNPTTGIILTKLESIEQRIDRIFVLLDRLSERVDNDR